MPFGSAFSRRQFEHLDDRGIPHLAGQTLIGMTIPT
jgi:hypothetical protein